MPFVSLSNHVPQGPLAQNKGRPPSPIGIGRLAKLLLLLLPVPVLAKLSQELLHGGR